MGKLTTEEKEQLCKLYKDTIITMPELAKKFHTSVSTATKIVRSTFSSDFCDARAHKSKTKNFEEKESELVRLFSDTDMALPDIAKQIGMSYTAAHHYLEKYFDSAYRQARKRRIHSKSLTGVPTGRCKEKHPLYKGGMYTQNFDGKENIYLMRNKPEWFTGATRTRYIPFHDVVVCENLGITEIPKGLIVHHCDGDRMHNTFDNLIVVPRGDHSAYHTFLRMESVTTMSKDSTLKWLAEVRGFTWKDWVTKNKDKVSFRVNEEIVSSVLEYTAAKLRVCLNLAHRRSWDIKNAEMRVLCAYSKDKTLIDAFNGNADLHSLTSAGISEYTYEDIMAHKEDKSTPQYLARQLGKRKFNAPLHSNM